MSSLAISLLVFVCLFGGSLLGIRLRNTLPGHHLSDEGRHLLEIGLGTIGTMGGLVLGLLVASASSTYNAQRNEVIDVSSKIVLLDRILARYGPAAHDARRVLYEGTRDAMYRLWPKEKPANVRLDPPGELERLGDVVEALPTNTDLQRTLKPMATGLLLTLAQTRWLLYEQNASSISTPLLIMLVFWFFITFTGFGMFAPSNATAFSALALCALAVSGAVFLMIEMYSPFSGLLQIPSDSIRAALAEMSKQ